jgi:hypothetical protein
MAVVQRGLFDSFDCIDCNIQHKCYLQSKMENRILTVGKGGRTANTICTPQKPSKRCIIKMQLNTKIKDPFPDFFTTLSTPRPPQKNLKMVVNLLYVCTFPLDGNWSEWSIYSVCSCQAKIDTGTKTKTRLCNNPLRQIGGNFCMPLANNVVENSTGIQKETQADACPCPLTGKL